MTLAHRQPARIDPGELIAAIPALLRSQPTESVVLVGFTATGAGLSVRCMLCRDIPTAGQLPAAGEQWCTAVIATEIDTVAVILVADAGDQSGGLPHRAVQRALVGAFDDAHLEVTDALWVARIEPGMPWRSYLDPDRAGTLPDPATGPVAAAAVLAGESD